MRRMVPMLFLTALLLYASSSTGIAQSAVVTLAPQSGPSKFVSEIGGKPAQIGTPAQGAQGSQREQLDVAIVPPSPQAMSEPVRRKKRCRMIRRRPINRRDVRRTRPREMRAPRAIRTATIPRLPPMRSMARCDFSGAWLASSKLLLLPELAGWPCSEYRPAGPQVTASLSRSQSLESRGSRPNPR